MEIFYSYDASPQVCLLDQEETRHCVKVLRHRPGDGVTVIDGRGTMYRCILSDTSLSGAVCNVVEAVPGWGAHPYRLTLAVCPTKNNDRYEWFAEKATEVGVDEIVPVIGEHSERKVYKTDRLRRILLSAAKQSLKAAIPQVREPLGVRDFIEDAPEDALKLIACCFEGEVPRLSVKEALEDSAGREIIVLIGPEGDFSPEEVTAAVARGFVPVHLGSSRLRTETAALTAAEAVYFHYM